MSLTDLLVAQLTDPFRLGLMIALLVTALRTRAATGLLLPLLAGVVFVALMLPMTMGLGAAAGLPVWQVMAVGVVANAVLLGGALAVWAGLGRLRP